MALSLGILFSQALSKEIPATTAPVEYVSALAVFFLVKSAPAFRVVFLVSVHCMIFTTLDTLLVTALQISHYRRATLIDRLLFRRDRLLYLLLAASVASCLIGKDHVHIVGIFIASLLCLLVLPCARALFPGPMRWLPEESSYLWWSLAIASAVFGLLERRIVNTFDYHFLLPGLVLASLALALGAQKLWGSWKRGRAVC